MGEEYFVRGDGEFAAAQFFICVELGNGHAGPDYTRDRGKSTTFYGCAVGESTESLNRDCHA
jgi:hypothetical protein